MPTALWRPVKSNFCGRKETVTSPGEPWGASAGTGKRWTVGLRGRRGSSHLSRVTTLLVSKYFQPLITLAAAHSARMIVFPPLGGSCLRVGL